MNIIVTIEIYNKHSINTTQTAYIHNKTSIGNANNRSGISHGYNVNNLKYTMEHLIGTI